MSLTGSRFSSESARGPFHPGVGGEVEQSLTRPCRQFERHVQAGMRTHLIHRPARDIFPLLGGSRVFSYWILILNGFHAHGRRYGWIRLIGHKADRHDGRGEQFKRVDRIERTREQKANPGYNLPEIDATMRCALSVRSG